MRYRILGKTGLKVSVLGYGASPLGNDFRTIDPAEGTRAVHCAIDHGINYFDVAPYYGHTLAETRLGAALEGKRDKVLLATKCGRYGRDNFDFSAARVTASLDESLRRLRTGYVDLFQAHDIEFGEYNQIVEETIPALCKLRDSGKIRFIGITGLPLKMMRRVATAAPVDAILSYSRYNLMITDMDGLLTPYAQAGGIGLINASPLHMGMLTEQGPPAWHPAPAAVKEGALKLVDFCRRRGVNLAEVALRFCLEHCYVSTTLIGMSSTAHLETNLRALEGRTDPELLAEIREIVEPVANITWPSGRPENNDYDFSQRAQG